MRDSIGTLTQLITMKLKNGKDLNIYTSYFENTRELITSLYIEGDEFNVLIVHFTFLISNTNSYKHTVCLFDYSYILLDAISSMK